MASSVFKVMAEKAGPAVRKQALTLTDAAASRTKKGKFDELVEDKGVKILIDPKALMHVIGTKMDFIDDPLRSEFVFMNPNSKGECGCGESFMTTTNKSSA